MMTEEDIKRAEGSYQPRTMTVDPEIVQWFMRSSYEEGWRDAGGDPIRSHHADEPKGWRLGWLNSKTREALIRQGLISGQDSYR